MRLLPLLLALLLLPACAPGGVGPEAAVPANTGWRTVATADDRARLRDWRKTWTRALEQARAAGHGSELAAEGALLDPDSALPEVAPAIGNYRCRTIKIGAKAKGMLDYVAYPPFDCRIDSGAGAGALNFAKVTGSQRPTGRIFPENDRRMIFLGTLQLGDEQSVLRYGHDTERDMAAVLERVGARRWRLAFPEPHFESALDILELVPVD